MHQAVGNTVCEWDNSVPLIWTMTETRGKENSRGTDTYSFDLASLRRGYGVELLLLLKDMLIRRHRRIALISVHREYSAVLALMRAMQDQNPSVPIVTQIDQDYLLSLRTIIDDIPVMSFSVFKRLFATNRTSPIFAPNLVPEDFPVKKPKKGRQGACTSRILTQALTRAAQVEILRIVEEAHTEGKIDIGQFSFLHLAFHLYCRPLSYRKLTLADLQIDIHPESKVTKYFLWVVLPKTRVHNPQKIAYQLNRFVGVLLETQRVHVVENYGHLVKAEDIDKLALFPARSLDASKNWVNAYAQKHMGATTQTNFRTGYLDPILRLKIPAQFNFNALRHTVGTQLAEAGCSAQTIQAVLKHASDYVCQAYVDIAFHGLIDKLSDTLKPAFEMHFPVFNAFRSKNEPVEPQKAIRSEDMKTERTELTGECGQMIACQYAPLACYSCFRFIPCYDADHSINIDAVDADIRHFELAGLPFKIMLERAQEIRRYIVLTMLAADRKRHALTQEEMV